MYAKVSSLVLLLEWISAHPASNPTQRSRPEREEPKMTEEWRFDLGVLSSLLDPGDTLRKIGWEEDGCRGGQRGRRGPRDFPSLQLPRKSGQLLEEQGG